MVEINGTGRGMTLEARTMSPEKASLLAYFFLTMTALCWAGNTIFGRLAVGQISPMLLVSLRWAVTVTLLAIFARGAIRREAVMLRDNWRFFAIMGAVGFTSFNAIYYVAAHSTTAVNMGIIQGAMPMFVFLFAFVVFRTPVGFLQIVGAIATMSGVAVVASAGSFARLAAFAFAWGDVLIVVACILYSGYTVALRNRPPVSALAMFAALAGSAFVVSLPLVAAEAAMGGLSWPTPLGWLIVFLVAIFPSVIAQICFIKGVELIGPGRAGVFVNLVPVFASIFAVVILSEAFRSYHMTALFLVLGGIWLSERGKPAAG
jgi:drug/metabolite transporter (DMT)-like permease